MFNASTGARLLVVLGVCATVLAYLPAIDGPFLFDDLSEIADNPAIRVLWPPWRPMFEGGDLPHRPLPYLTFAVNHAVGRALGVDPLRPLPFHVVNVAIHVANGWLLAWCLRRTLVRPAFAAVPGSAAAGWPAVPAAAAAAIWLVHPLQTEAVSYVYQRIELLAAAAALGTLAAFLASLDSRRPVRWLVASVACCGLGMACKEWMVVVPVVMLLFDRALVSRSWREVGGRWPYHLSLFTTWGVLAAVLAVEWGRYPEAGFTLAQAATYAVNQPLIVLWYLSRLFVPAGLSLDHGDVLRTGIVGRDAWLLVPCAAAVAAAIGALVALPRRPVPAFATLAFLLLLAPTSSVLPVHDACVEHRMYCAAALPIAAAVVAGWAAVAQRMGPAGFATVAAACVVALAAVTAVRNTVYASPLAAWADAAAKSGGSSRALARYGTELSNLDRHAEAVQACAAAVRAGRTSPVPHAALAAALINAGRLEEAAAAARAGIATPGAQAGPDPVRDRLRMYLGIALDRAGDPAGVPLLREAVARRPDSLPAREHLARALVRTSPREAATLWQGLVAVSPRDARVHFQFGNALARFAPPAAAAAYGTSIRLDPANPDAFNNLGGVLLAMGRVAEARAAFQQCLRLAPDHPQAVVNIRDPRLAPPATPQEP